MQQSQQDTKYEKGFNPLSEKEELIGKAIVEAAFKVHSTLGPGLLKKIYESYLAYELAKAGFEVKRQLELPIKYDNLIFEEGLRLDLLVGNLVICEIKAVDTINAVWNAQVISHLKLTNKRLGYLINFNVPLIKNGIKRFVI